MSPNAQRCTSSCLLLALVLAGGSYVRLVHLGLPSFRADEVQHYHAAVALQEGLGPLNPAGNPYLRGIDITRMVSILDRFISPPELAARLPAAGFGILSLVLIAAIGWLVGGPWVAFWAAFLLAIYPEAIWQSRQVRFYTYQLSLALGALGVGWWTFRAWKEALPSPRSVWLGWTGFTLTFGLLLLATRVQVVSLSVIAGWGTFLLLAGLSHLRSHGWRRSHLNVPLQWVGLGVGASAVAVLMNTERVLAMGSSAFGAPGWYGAGSSVLTYYYALAEGYPVLVSLSPVIMGVVLYQHRWLGAYLLAWFLVPFLLNSALFTFRQERFLLSAIPALFLLGALAATDACRALQQGVTNAAANSGLAGASLRWAAPTCVAIAVAGLLSTTPAFNAARKVPDPSTWPDIRREDWRATVPIVRAFEERGEHVALGSTDSLASLHYWGRTDVQVVQDDLADLELFTASGVPVLGRPEALRLHLAEYDAVILGLDSERINAGRLDPDLLRVLERDAVELCEGRCGTLLLYRWVLSEAEGPEPPAGGL